MIDSMSMLRSLAATTRIDPPSIKGSRFIGDAAPIESVAEAQAFIREIAGREPGANHHCYAWRLSLGDQDWRAFDDGEPGGTAGMPILARIDGAELQGLVIVVTRYFGGTKLGRGGLIRAYGGTAGRLLEQAEIISRPICELLKLTLDYADQGRIQRVLRSHELVPSQEHFGKRVEIQIQVPVDQRDRVVTDLRDGTAGRVQIEPRPDQEEN
jgi:uncharacterized YigZ family protein